MNSGDSTTTKSFRLLVNLSDKKDLKGVINMLLHQILVCIIHRKTQKTLKKNPFELSTPTWKEKFECGGSYSIADI